MLVSILTWMYNWLDKLESFCIPGWSGKQNGHSPPEIVQKCCWTVIQKLVHWSYRKLEWLINKNNVFPWWIHTKKGSNITLHASTETEMLKKLKFTPSNLINFRKIIEEVFELQRDWEKLWRHIFLNFVRTSWVKTRLKIKILVKIKTKTSVTSLTLAW